MHYRASAKVMNIYAIYIQFLIRIYFLWQGTDAFSLDHSLPTGVSSGPLKGSVRGPVFTLNPPAKLSFSNSTGGSIPCTAGGTDPPPKVTWIKKDARPVHMIPGVLEISPNGTLHFPPFAQYQYDTTVHDALYRCKAIASSGIVLSLPVQVRGVVDGEYEVQVYDKFVMYGNTGVLKCSVPSYVQEYVAVTSWLHDSAFNIYPSLHGDGKYHMTPSGELLVLNVGPQDGHSRFQCRTLHKLTGATQLSRTPARIIVTEPQGTLAPRISDRAPRVDTTTGRDVLLPCIAQGHPPPQYSWYHGSTPLHRSDRSWKVGGSLVLVGVGSEDSGEYHCVANNSAGSSRHTTHLSISTPLSVQINPVETEVDSGKSLDLKCHISGHPINKVSWYKDGTLLRPSSRIGIRPRDVLHISPVDKLDAGVYQCEANSDTSFANAQSYVSLGASAPNLSYRFISQTLQPGPSVSLKCIASGTPPPQITWTLDGFKLPESHRFLIGQYVSSHGDVISHVNISSVRVSDGGSYKCEASNTAGIAYHSARLNIYGPPQVRPMGRISAVAGENFQVTCPVGGHPIDKIIWKKDGVRLPANHRQRALSNGTLAIKKVSRGTDDGLYSCTAFNRQDRSHTQTLTLSVIVPPRLAPFVFPEGTRAGMRTQAACFVQEGDQPISLRWEKDGQPLQDLPNFRTNQMDPFTSMLILEKVSAIHTGNYSCVATNAVRTAKYTASLTVRVPPEWVNEPTGSSVSLGGAVSLQCLAKGFPDPKTSWKKETVSGEFVPINSDLSMGVRAYENGSLSLSRAERRHEGRYLCEANNDVGGGLSKVISLHVNEPPWFALRSQRVQVEVDALARLSCLAKGDPPLNIIWTRDGAPLPPYPRYEVTERESEGGTSSDLLVRRAQVLDSATFVCEASNPHGTLTSDFHLIVQDVPFSPGGLNVAEKGARYMTIAWAIPSDSNAPITSYVVTYSQHWTQRKGLSREITVDGSKDRVQISDLLPATTYIFTVAAENRVGRSQPSPSIREATLEEEPRGFPQNVRVSAISSTALQVTWDPPKENETHGLILGYYLGYKDGSIDRSEPATEPGAYNFTTIGVEGLGVTSATLTSLRPFTKYSVVIQAFNSRGAGPSSPSVYATTLEDKPSAAPTRISCDSLSSSSLKINWSPPSVFTANGKIISYRVTFRLENPKAHDGSGMVISEILSTKLSDLEPWSNYSISVAASTRAGEGVTSKPIICTTLEDVPAAPDRVKAVVTGSRSATVSWSYPDPPNGKITGYTVYWSPVNSKANPVSRYVDAPTNYLTLHDLKSEVNEIWVKASTSMGQSGDSKKVVVTPSRKVSAGIWSVGGNVTVGWKDDVQMPCKTVGKPSPKVSWSHLGQNVPPKAKRITILPDGTLRIIDTQRGDSGSYTCKATNTHGSDIVLYSLNILVPPTRPLLHVTETTASSIRLQWSVEDNGGAPIKSSILYFRAESGETKEIEVLGSRASHTVGGLRCGTSHHFFVTTTNRIGTSDASMEVQARTKGRAPEPPPLFQFVTTNSSQATLYFTQWESGGCDITHFYVQYRLHNSGNSWTTVGTEVPPTRTFPVTGLRGGRKYDLRVRAFNAAGSTMEMYVVSTPSSGKAGFRESEIEGDSYMIINDREMSITENFWTDPRILIPAVISILAILLTIATVIICLKKKPNMNENSKKTFTDEYCAAHATKGMKGGDLIQDYQIYSPVRRLPPTPHPPPPSENRDSAADFSEDDAYQYATTTYQIRRGSPPPPCPPSPTEPHRVDHPHKGFTALVYQAPSLHDVDSPNTIPGERCSVPPDIYRDGDVSETDDYGSLAEGDINRQRLKVQRIKKNRKSNGGENVSRTPVSFHVESPKSFSSSRNVVRSQNNTIRPKARIPGNARKQQQFNGDRNNGPNSEAAECDMPW